MPLLHDEPSFRNTVCREKLLSIWDQFGSELLTYTSLPSRAKLC